MGITSRALSKYRYRVRIYMLKERTNTQEISNRKWILHGKRILLIKLKSMCYLFWKLLFCVGCIHFKRNSKENFNLMKQPLISTSSTVNNFRSSYIYTTWAEIYRDASSYTIPAATNNQTKCVSVTQVFFIAAFSCYTLSQTIRESNKKGKHIPL